MSQYNAEDIEVLTGLEPVRKRPGMYTDTTRPNHLIQEVVDNSVDEAIAGHAREIEVTLYKNGGIEVIDDGRGMPVDIHPEQGKPGVEVILSTLHAGGKFSAEEMWRVHGHKNVANHWSTPVYKDGYLYGMFSFKKYGEGPLACVEIATGDIKWEKEGFGPGNVILVGDPAGESVERVEQSPGFVLEMVQAANGAAAAPLALRHRLRRDPLDETGSTARIARAVTEVLGV